MDDNPADTLNTAVKIEPVYRWCQRGASDAARACQAASEVLRRHGVSAETAYAAHETWVRARSRAKRAEVFSLAVVWAKAKIAAQRAHNYRCGEGFKYLVDVKPA
jgi:hypothetical protein